MTADPEPTFAPRFLDDDYDGYEDYEEMPEGAIWCDRCQGMGIANCYCGGDQCYCENYGERECPTCCGEGYYVPTAAQLQREAEMRALLASALNPEAETPNPKSGTALSEEAA